MINSRAKGARAERELAKVWSETVGGTARRGQQFAGGTESPDVVTSQENIHLEVKRVEKGNPYQWMAQAVRDAGPKLPIVLHRRNGEEWLAIVRLSDVPRLAAELGQQAAPVDQHPLPADVSGAGVPPAGGADA
jgi:hypothetical protein